MRISRQAQATVEEARKRLRAQFYREQEAERNGYVDCGEGAAGWCVSGDKCAEINCPEEDCRCSLEELGGGEWDPERQRGLRDQAELAREGHRPARAQDGAVGAAGGGGRGARPAGGGGAGPAAGPEAGPAQEPVVSYDSAES